MFIYELTLILDKTKEKPQSKNQIPGLHYSEVSSLFPPLIFSTVKSFPSLNRINRTPCQSLRDLYKNTFFLKIHNVFIATTSIHSTSLNFTIMPYFPPQLRVMLILLEIKNNTILYKIMN